ncbi:Hypothetical protein, putative [Bodo saltans]|uniref:PH-like domain-containing protein n=1 Tax=Bodo saltans TaxID=75058 RepID=A0A0S4J871_BODSA|nr:Hypothetical protein, putative [Bodo saltans]|eukprot:CUG86285.1 Hypothetical protein, putative [Bodo saltans]
MPSALVPKLSYGPDLTSAGSFSPPRKYSSYSSSVSTFHAAPFPASTHVHYAPSLRSLPTTAASSAALPHSYRSSEGLGRLFQSSSALRTNTSPPPSGRWSTQPPSQHHFSPPPSFRDVVPRNTEAAGFAYSHQPALAELNLPEAVEEFRAAHRGHAASPTTVIPRATEEFDDQASWETSSHASTVSMPPLPSDDTPLVPIEFLSNSAEPLPWQGHPCAPIVLALLNARGVFLPAFKDVVSYHMAPAFLKALTQLCLGSYFIKYGVRKSAPKERFFSVRMSENSSGITVPFLCWTVHQHAMQLVDKVPLTHFVGISLGTSEIAFQRYLVTGSVIKGCRQGPHHAKLPTHGAFTLWFFDQRSGKAKGLSLLTCATSVFELWIGAMNGILAVNSVSLRQISNNINPQGGGDIDQFLKRAQRQVRDQYLNAEDADDDDAAGEFLSG